MMRQHTAPGTQQEVDQATPWLRDNATCFDGLAGLTHRRRLIRLIRQATSQARRQETPLTICSLDIDNFQQINQQFGHAVGDTLLALLAQRVGSLIAQEDDLIHLGGDEFALLIHQEIDSAYLHYLLDAIYQPIVLNDESLQVSVSIGVTYFPYDDSIEEVLLRHATQAMYQAKQLGGNTYRIFDCHENHRRQRHRTQCQNFIEALNRQELCLYYQPQVDMLSRQVVGMEALLRWQHPQRGLLLPGEFLPSIEGTDIEILLGEWVIEQALMQLERWQKKGLTFPVSVNISPLHLLADNFADRLEMLLARYPRVPTQRLQLEILETAAITDTRKASSAIRRCQALNIHVSIDDFGTGFSSLIHLRKLPVNAIKIDREFVREMLHGQEDMAVVESIIYLAKRFGHSMLAEGVETPAHARALVELGCQLAQGFGIARPMPEADLGQWLDDWRSRLDWAHLGISDSLAMPA